MYELASIAIDRVVTLALEEDLASGDVTTEACVTPDARAVAHAMSRHALVVVRGHRIRTSFPANRCVSQSVRPRA